MRIGYPCINRTIGCSAGRTFRLANYSEHRFVKTAGENIQCLEKILKENARQDFLFHRITSDIIPFASHPVCTVDWHSLFSGQLARLGRFIRKYRMRISMHPDQFTLINSPDKNVFERSVRELLYHADLLDLMGLETDARIQIHVGGVYGNKTTAIKRFVERFETIDHRIRGRLVIENDDRLYTFSDCISIYETTGIPVVFDNLHHAVNSSGESIPDVFNKLTRIWPPSAGIPMTDYSCPMAGAKAGRHAEHIDMEDFESYLLDTEGFDFDIMLEIKDKEKSAASAVTMVRNDPRFMKLSSEIH